MLKAWNWNYRLLLKSNKWDKGSCNIDAKLFGLLSSKLKNSRIVEETVCTGTPLVECSEKFALSHLGVNSTIEKCSPFRYSNQKAFDSFLLASLNDPKLKPTSFDMIIGYMIKSTREPVYTGSYLLAVLSQRPKLVTPATVDRISQFYLTLPPEYRLQMLAQMLELTFEVDITREAFESIMKCIKPEFVTDEEANRCQSK